MFNIIKTKIPFSWPKDIFTVKSTLNQEENISRRF